MPVKDHPYYKGSALEKRDNMVETHKNPKSPWIREIASGFDTITSNTSGFIKEGGCVQTWPYDNRWYPRPTWENWPETPIQTIYTTGDAVEITVIETMAGYVGQISMMMDKKKIIVWESPAQKAADFAKTTKEWDEATDGVKEAQEAARTLAQAHASDVLRKLFS